MTARVHPVRRLVGGSRGLSALAWCLLTAVVLGAALLPRSLDALARAETGSVLDAAPSGQLDLRGSGRLGTTTGAGLAPNALLDETDRVLRELPDRLDADLAGAVGTPAWVARTQRTPTTAPRSPQTPLALRLTVDPGWREHVELDEGAWPTRRASRRAPLEIAVARPLADRLDLRVGDRLPFTPTPVVVTAVVSVLDPDGAFAVNTGDVVAPTVLDGDGPDPAVEASVLVDPTELDRLQSAMTTGTLTVWVPVRADRIDPDRSDVVAAAVRQLGARSLVLPYGGSVVLRSGLPDLLAVAADRVRATTVVVAFGASMLAGVLAGVLGAVATTLVRRRGRELATLAARGASPWQTGLLGAVEGLLLAVPAAVVGVGAAAWLLPGPVGASGWWLPLLAAAVLPVLLAMRSARPPVDRAEDDHDAPGRLGALATGTAVVLAAVATLLLLRRGLGGDTGADPSADVGPLGGLDPLLLAVPLLVTAAVAAVVVRALPLALGPVRRLLRRSGGSTSLLGPARAVLAPVVGPATALALVVGVAASVFGAVMVGTTDRALVQGARDDLGADVVAEATSTGVLAPPDGVTASARLAVVPDVVLDLAGGQIRTTVVVGSLADLLRVRPDLPDLPTPEAGGVLLSDAWPTALAGATVTLPDGSAQVGGRLPERLLPGLEDRWLLVDDPTLDVAALGAASPARELLLLDVDDDAPTGPIADAVRAEAPRGVVVNDVDRLVAERAGSPATRALGVTFVVTAVVALALAVLALALAAAGAAAARARVLAVLRVLGAHPRRLAGIVVWELAPAALAAAVVGTLAGWGLAVLMTTGLDLRPFLGGREPPPVVVDPLLVAGAVGAFAVVCAATVVVCVMLGRRAAPAATLRMGER